MRAFIIETLYEYSKRPYQKWFKKEEPWDLTPNILIQYPQRSLGFHLGCFLLKHDFTLQAKLENHDVFHVLTNTGISVPEEIAMQYYLFGNGKRSIYLLLVILSGIMFYPDYISLFYRAYQKGKKAFQFYTLDFKKLLDQPLQKLKTTFLISSL